MRFAGRCSVRVLTYLCLASLSSSRAHAQSNAAADEAELARNARLDTIMRLALERNPDLAETRARAGAAQARSQAASRLPDLEAKYEQWGVPLSRPFALDRSDTLMVGVRQTFPAWGSLEARGRAAAEDAGSSQDAIRARRQELTAQVRRAFAAYYMADQELRLHREHVALTGRTLELVRLNQRTGHAGVQDILRLQLELTRLHTDVARIEREQRSSRALLNVLMNRPPHVPLGPPEALAIPPVTDLNTLAGAWEGRLDRSRPEIGAAERAIRRSEALLEATRRSARFPSVTLGVDYWYMPMAETRHGYGAMVGINLPWLSGRHRDEEREAEQMVKAEQQVLQSTRNSVRYQLLDASARLDSARQSFTTIDEDLLVQARRNLDAVQSAYAAGQGDAVALLDALRAYLQVRIERVRALAELANSQADLERATGVVTVEGGGR